MRVQVTQAKHRVLLPRSWNWCLTPRLNFAAALCAFRSRRPSIGSSSSTLSVVNLS